MAIIALVGCTDTKDPLEIYKEYYPEEFENYVVNIDSTDYETVIMSFERSGNLEKTIEYSKKDMKFSNFKDTLFSEHVVFSNDGLIDEKSWFISLKPVEGVFDLTIHGSEKADSIVVSTKSNGRWLRLGLAAKLTEKRAMIKGLAYHDFYEVSFYQKPKMTSGGLTFEIPVLRVQTKDKMSENLFNDINRMKDFSRTILELKRSE